MYSLITHEKQREEVSAREILWRNLRDRKKSGRMVRRIYNKTREEMAQSRKERSQRWIEGAAADIESWSRTPELSVYDHTFRDRWNASEVGPANGHVSALKYIPRLVLSGGGKLDGSKMADLVETLSVPRRWRGNVPNALYNPCRPTVVINDTAKIRGRLEHPHWEAPRYCLRVREKAKEIGPDVQYADRNDMQRIFSGVLKNSLFAWGPYEGGGPWDAPTCRQENPEKWVGDHNFYPGFRYRDNQRERITGGKFPADLLNDDNYKSPTSFSRDRNMENELPQHDRFRLVVRSNELSCPVGKVRRSLRFEEATPKPYPNKKTYLKSLKSEPITSATAGYLQAADPKGGRLQASSSLGTIVERNERTPNGKDKVFMDDATYSEWGDKPCVGPEHSPLLPSKSSSVARLFSENGQAIGEAENGKKPGQCEESTGKAWRQACRLIKRNDDRIANIVGLRRGSEVASWATCSARDKSARDYLW